MDSTGKASSGSPFKPPPAVIWNNMVDAGRAHANSQFDSGPPGATRTRPTDLIKLRNSSGAARAKGEILKIDGKVISTVTDENIWLDGVEITAGCRFGILKAPAAEDAIVTAQVSGVCLALVNITNTAHTFAGATSGHVLQSGTSGPLEILYAPSGTGEKECVVRFTGGVSCVCGILTSAVTAASPDGLTGATNFTFKIWRPDPTDSSSPQQYIQDTDDTTGVNRSLTTGTSGSFCICMYINGEYWPIWIDCV